MRRWKGAVYYVGVLILAGGSLVVLSELRRDPGFPDGPARSVAAHVAVPPEAIPVAMEKGGETCEGCHALRAPGMLSGWAMSAHGRVGVGCAACHGDNHVKIFAADGRVEAAVCGGCHGRAFEGFKKSRHSRPVPAEIFDRAPGGGGCRSSVGCHAVGRPGAPAAVGGRCGACHPSHAGDALKGKDPALCASCHRGPEFPEYEAWAEGPHGVAWRAGGRLAAGPTCATCHMPGGDHDDRRGVIRGVVSPSPRPFVWVRTVSRETFDHRREEAMRVCTACHGRRLVRTALKAADDFRLEGAVAIARVASLIHPGGRATAGYLDLPPHARFLDLIEVRRASFDVLERGFLRLVAETYPAAWRAAYHGDPHAASDVARMRLLEEAEGLAEAARRRRAAAAAGKGAGNE